MKRPACPVRSSTAPIGSSPAPGRRTSKTFCCLCPALPPPSCPNCRLSESPTASCSRTMAFAPSTILSSARIELQKRSGTKDWSLHDLRRTARSLMSRAGVPRTTPNAAWVTSSAASARPTIATNTIRRRRPPSKRSPHRSIEFCSPPTMSCRCVHQFRDNPERPRRVVATPSCGLTRNSKGAFDVTSYRKHYTDSVRPHH